MKIIDARKKLTAQSIADFKDGQDNATIVDIVSDKTESLFTCTLDELENFFKRNDVEEAFTEDDDIIYFMSQETTLQILGLDFKYFIAPVRGVKYKRLEKLFGPSDMASDSMRNISSKKSAVTADKSAKPQKTHFSIQCATFDKDDNIVDIQVIEGVKNDFIRDLNQHYSMTILRSHFENTVKFRFNDDEDWQTFDELKDKGVFLV